MGGQQLLQGAAVQVGGKSRAPGAGRNPRGRFRFWPMPRERTAAMTAPHPDRTAGHNDPTTGRTTSGTTSTDRAARIGQGGEVHQPPDTDGPRLTTAQGIPISYDPVYDEFNVGLTDTRPKAARKVHIDQISAPERGLGATGIPQARP